VCKGAIGPGVEYAETYLEAVWAAAKRASQAIKTEAARKGTELHRAIEQQLASPDELQSGGTTLYPLRGWLEGQSIRLVRMEQRIYSRRHRYSGTFDALGETESGSRVLLDWKTSKSIYPEFRLQTAAYVHAYEEEFPDKKIEGRYLVRIAEDGSIEPHYYPRSALRLDFAAFLGAKKLFERVAQIEKESRKLLKTKGK
jgi:hypothetical protein